MAKTPKPIKPKAKKTAKEQSERFIETARRLGADESGEPFEHSLRKLIPPKKVKNGPSRK
jgi:hypothetical protein